MLLVTRYYSSNDFAIFSARQRQGLAERIGIKAVLTHRSDLSSLNRSNDLTKKC